MKVLLLCMAFSAVSLAMPVAEDKAELPLAPTPVAEPKDDQTKPQADALPAPVEEIKPEQKPEIKDFEKAPEPKSAPVDDVPEAIKPESAPEVKAEEKPEEKTEVKSVADVPEPEQKPEASQTAESKPVEKLDNPEPKPAAVESKSAESQATVKEIPNVPSAKSGLTEDIIDVDSALKSSVAAVADDAVDSVAIIPTPEKKIDLPEIVVKEAKVVPEDKNKETPSPAAESVKPEDNKQSEPETIIKPASKSDEAGIVSDDSLRVVRDTVVDKAQLATPAAPNVEAAPVDAKKVEVESNETPKDEIPTESEKKEEQAKELKTNDPVKVPESTKNAQPAIDSTKTAVSETKNVMSDEAQNEQPAPSSSSEEESGEVKPQTKGESTEKDDTNSSEESGEKTEKKSAPKS